MKKTLSIILSLIMALSAFSVMPFSAFALSGEGTSENPYQIGTAEELKAFRDIVNGGEDAACAVLTANIDLNNEEWTPIGDYNSGDYKGIFDGQNFSVKGLKIESNIIYAGLFGEIQGTVKNINVIGSVSVPQTSSEHEYYVGGVVASIYHGTLQNCSFNGDVSLQNSDTNGLFMSVGGVAGYVVGLLENCSHNGNVFASGRGPKAGGVAGYSSWNTTVRNCFHIGKVTNNGTGETYAGGVTSYINSTTVKYCYSYGEISATSSEALVGGIIGYNNGTTTGCYYLDGTAAQSVGLEKGTTTDSGALTALQFKDGGCFTYWDFNNVWYMGADAPQLIDIKTPVGTWADLKTALQTSGSYKLTADVVPSNAYWDDALSVPNNVNAVLDLNGHIVDRGYREDSTQLWDGSVIKISGNFTVIDSNPTATHETPVTYTDPITGRELTVNGGIITGGFADQYGGGVQVQGGIFNLKGGSIVNNNVGKNGFGAVEGLGGGVYIQSGNFNMSGGAILGNKASNKNTMAPDTPLGKGGAVYIGNGTFALSGGLIRGNVAGADLGAGGIYVGTNGTFSMTGGTLVGNYSKGCANVNRDEGTSTEFNSLPLESNDGNNYITIQTFVKGSTAPLATDVFARDGYDFIGWSEYDDGSGLTFADGADITYSPGMFGGSALYAQWQAYTLVDEVPATCTETGTKAHYKSLDGTLYLKDGATYTKVTDESQLEIPALTHDYGEPTYNWTQENGVWKCTAERVCANDASHKETEMVEGAGAEKTPATCTEKGTTTYTATFTNAAFEQQTKEVDDIPALTHNYGESTYEWTQENGVWKCTAKRVCARDASHIETETVEGAGAEKEPATCTENGTTTYTATFTNTAFEQQTKDVDDIPALTHDYTSAVTPPTCTEQGYTTYTCTRGDDEYKDDYVDALGHKYGAEGDERFTCTVCGAVDETLKAEAEAADKDAADTAAAKAVTDMINALPEKEEITTADEAAIEKARKAYDSLTDDQKAKVTPETVNKLTEAEKALAEEKAEEATAAKEKAKAEFIAGVDGTSTESSAIVKWGKVNGAKRYAIYAAYCDKNHKYKYKKIKTVSGKVTKYEIKKLYGRKLNPKKNIKVYIVAQKKKNGKWKKIFKTPTFHIAGAKSKYSNVKKITVKKNKYTLKVGKTAKIKAKIVLADKSKKAVNHVRKLRFKSTNTAVVKVTKSGKIKAVGKGKATVFVYSNNGTAKAIKVTVK